MLKSQRSSHKGPQHKAHINSNKSILTKSKRSNSMSFVIFTFL
jgi:hypothetical protein